ncbi:MAG: NAD(P)H-binding protein [Synechococcus lacustris]
MGPLDQDKESEARDGNFKMILVTAASGMFGSAVVRALSTAGLPVRASSRNIASLQGLAAPGVELVAADMDDPASLGPLLAGVDRVLVNAPMDSAKESRERNVIEAMQRAGNNAQIVLLTGGVQHDDALGDAGRAIEAVMRNSGLPWTIVGPQSVMESNFLPWRTAVQQENAIIACCGDAKIGFVALQDVADAFVAVLTQPIEQNQGREYIITGPEAVSWSDAASAASRALGRPIALDDMDRADFRAMMINWGAFTDDTVDIGIMCHQDAFREGKAARISQDFTTLTGRPATTIEQWWQQYAEHFLTPTGSATA